MPLKSLLVTNYFMEVFMDSLKDSKLDVSPKISGARNGFFQKGFG